VVVFDDVERDVRSIRLARWGRVVAAEDVVPWRVVDAGGWPVEAIERFLRDFVVTADDQHYIIDLNPNGQWGWIQEATRLPIAAAIAAELFGEDL